MSLKRNVRYRRYWKDVDDDENPFFDDDRSNIKFSIKKNRRIEFEAMLARDELRRGEFLRNVIAGYVDGDRHILEFIQDLKKDLNIQNDKKRKCILAENNEKYKNIDEFALSTKEIENIYDMIQVSSEELDI